MKVILLGLNDIGKKVLDYLKSLQQDEIYLIVKKDELKKVQGIQPDIILSVGFRHIVPKEILKIPPLGAINFHKSLLPLHRGANPVFWTILDRTKAGVTIHYMDEGIDTGRIIAQKQVDIGFQDTAETLYHRLEFVQMELFKGVWPDIRKGRIIGNPQSGESSYHVINDFMKMRKIDPEKIVTSMDFISYLKAMTFPPFQNAYIEHEGKKFFIEVAIREEKEYPLINSSKTTMLSQYNFKND